MRKINESFSCIVCKKQIAPTVGTCRNHCPYCFASLHVDGAIPGDRKTDCHGLMLPRAYEIKNGGLKILFECTRCHKKHWNKRALDDEVEHLDRTIQENRSHF